MTRMALRIGPAIFVVLSFIAVLLGIIFHSISIDELKYRDPPAQHFDSNIVIDDKPKDLLWFLQVTDLHISCRGHFERQKDFEEFVDRYIDIIKPSAVLVTGDITDGLKKNTKFGSGPQLEEWLAYSEAVTQSGALNKTRWLDIRGNHDNFNVYRPEDPSTLYRQYSVQGKSHSHNYIETIEKDGKNYSFIGVDEVQTPGLKIPFNFLGIVKDEDLSELAEFKKLSKERNSQYNIWFAHYPTSSLVSSNEGIRNIIDGPYLCGHFHTIGNMVTKMHATQQPGYAEVELGDWKYNRRLRLAAIDHQLFSLVDVDFRQFPIALMTNPKTAEHVMPKYEPVGRIMNSTHIRVIAFSNSTLSSVEISIDGLPSSLMDHSEGPLYVLKWNPKQYETGLHEAKIVVKDSAGKFATYTQKFSMDNSKEESSFGAKILIRAYFKSGVMTIFYFIVVVCTFPMVILRFVVCAPKETSFRRHYRGTLIHLLHVLCGIDRLFWPLILIPVWMAVGPMFFGYMVDEAIGACFVWGVLIDGTFVHTGITYNVGSIFLLFIHIPNTILLIEQVGDCYCTRASDSPALKKFNIKMLLYLVITALQSWMGYLLFTAYGLLSYVTSFPYLWCVALYAYCWYQCTTIKRSDFAKFDMNVEPEERQALTSNQRVRDDKSSTSEHSTT